MKLCLTRPYCRSGTDPTLGINQKKHNIFGCSGLVSCSNDGQRETSLTSQLSAKCRYKGRRWIIQSPEDYYRGGGTVLFNSSSESADISLGRLQVVRHLKNKEKNINLQSQIQAEPEQWICLKTRFMPHPLMTYCKNCFLFFNFLSSVGFTDQPFQFSLSL